MKNKTKRASEPRKSLETLQKETDLDLLQNLRCDLLTGKFLR